MKKTKTPTKTPTPGPSEEMVELASKLAHLMKTAPVDDVIVATVAAFDEFQSVFYGFLSAQKAFKSDQSIRIVDEAPPPGVQRH